MRRYTWLLVLMLAGCAGLSRSCSSCNAGAFGSDWIVVQYSTSGYPINCWKLSNAAISNEAQTDGIYWQDPQNSNLVHISGWYNRVQVELGDFTGAARSIGIDLSKCTSGKYQ